MTKRIAIIQGHPDPSRERFCRALAAAYARGATAVGHTIEIIEVADLSIPFLRTKTEFEHGEAPADVRRAQTIIRAADHLVLIFPLWLGDVPAMLKAFIEQTFRPGFAYGGDMQRGRFHRLLNGKSARVIVTMGMPAFIYRLYFGAHGLKNLRRNILKFCGVSPVRESLIGLIEGRNPKTRQRWLAKAESLGRAGV